MTTAQMLTWTVATGRLGSIVVGPSNRYDYHASFSNIGSTVALFALGDGVRSASSAGSTATRVVSGTSFAAPYTAGTIAAFLQQNPTATASRVRDLIIKSATQNVLGDIGTGSPNRLLYSLFTSATISGTTYVATDYARSVTWTALTSGGDGNFTYLWEVSINGSPFSVVSTARTYTRSFAAGETYSLTLRLTGTSLGTSQTSTIIVTVEMPPPPEQCGGPKVC